MKTFRRGGIYLLFVREMTENRAVEVMPAPEKVVIPIEKSFGVPAGIIKKKGDSVKTGALIAGAKTVGGANVHASIAGKIKATAKYALPDGRMSDAFEIESDGTDSWEESIERADPNIKGRDYEPDELKEMIRKAGVVRMSRKSRSKDGNLFPVRKAKIDAAILNGLECEPFMTASHRLMIERPAAIVEGFRMFMRAYNVEKAYVGVDCEKIEDYELFLAEAEKIPGISIDFCLCNYPQDREPLLVKTIMNRSIRPAGSPMDAGVVVLDPASAIAVYEAAAMKKPLVERVVAVAGDAVVEPKNLLVRIGTPVGEIIDYCGGIKGDIGQLILGGSMTGRTADNFDVPILETTDLVLLLSREETTTSDGKQCVRCGACVDVCPMGLVPANLFDLARKGNRTKELIGSRILDCIECGSCSYICPAGRRFVQAIRGAKELL